jgi:hypothetical protein
MQICPYDIPCLVGLNISINEYMSKINILYCPVCSIQLINNWDQCNKHSTVVIYGNSKLSCTSLLNAHFFPVDRLHASPQISIGCKEIFV